jgi:WD40 repeat protein
MMRVSRYQANTGDRGWRWPLGTGAKSTLNGWLESPQPVCLLLGEFGTGKTTVAKQFAARLARAAFADDSRPVIFVDLRNWSGPIDLAGLIRRTLGVDNVAPFRFAIEEGECILMLDGFDEMSNRLTPAELAGAFQKLLAWGTQRSKVLLTCRTHLFIDIAQRDEIFSQALGTPLKTPTLGEVQDAWVLELQLFDEQRILEYLGQIAPGEVDATWAKIKAVHNLEDLAHRPILLDMIRQTLPKLGTSERVAVGDLYETYVQDWAAWAGRHGQEWFRPEEKIAFAEVLAHCIWRGGKDVESDAVRWNTLLKVFTDHYPASALRKLDSVDAAMLEIRAGSFLVWADADEGGLYRLAHRSFLEYLLARRVVRELARGDRSVLELPRFSPEVVAYCMARSGWNTAKAEVEATLAARYIPLASENALLLAHADGTIHSSKARPWQLEGARLDNMDLHGARLEHATFSGADLSRTSLRGACATAARFDHAVLDVADLAGADFSNAQCIGLRARGADLAGTCLERADLRRAQLQGSVAYAEPPRLKGAVLEGTNIAGAAWREPATEVDLHGIIGALDARWRGPIREDFNIVSVVEPLWHQNSVTGIAFSDDDARIATSCLDGAVRVWEANTGRLILTFRDHTRGVTSVNFTGGIVASASFDKTARLWSVDSGQTITVLGDHNDWVTAVLPFPDHERVLTASFGAATRVWDIGTGRPVLTLQDKHRSVFAAAVSPDGTRIATSPLSEVAQLWDGTTGEAVGDLTGHTKTIESMAFSSTGNQLATASSDKTVRVWDTSTGKSGMVVRGHSKPVEAVQFSPDDRYLATASRDDTAKLWDAKSGQLVLTLEGHTGAVEALAFSSAGDWLGTASRDGTARIWSTADGQCVLGLRGSTARVRPLGFSSDGLRLATASSNGTMYIWDALRGHLINKINEPRSAFNSETFSCNGELLAAGSYETAVRIWNASTGNLVQTLQGHRFADRVALSSERDLVAAGTYDGNLVVRRITDGASLLDSNEHGARIISVSFSADGRRLVSISRNKTLILWDTQKGRMLRVFRGHMGAISASTLSPDGKCVVTSSRGQIARAWNLSTGRILKLFRADADRIATMAFSANGKFLATASNRGTVQVWDFASGRLLCTIHDFIHDAIEIALSQDGQRVATSTGQGNIVRMWQSETGRLLGTFFHSSSVCVCASGPYAVPSGNIDLDSLVVCTGARCAPLSLYADICIRPDLVAASLAGQPVPPLSIAMDVAERRVGAASAAVLPPLLPARARPPADLAGPALQLALNESARHRDPTLAEQTLQRCAAAIDGHATAGLAATLPLRLSLPVGLIGTPGFRITAKAILPGATEEIAADLPTGTLDALYLPASPPGRIEVTLTFSLDRAERTLVLAVSCVGDNPYIAGPWVGGANLIGRENTLTQLRNRLGRGSVRLVGERRIGKTSILRDLLEHPGEGWIPIFMDGQELAGTALPFREWIAGEVRGGIPEAPGPDDLARHLRTIAAVGRRVLLLVDEIVHFARRLAPGDAAWLRALSTPPLTALFAGSASDWRRFFAAIPRQEGSPFNHLQELVLRPLSDAEMRRVVVRPDVLPPPDDAVALVLKLAEGRPYLAQRLCYLALERADADGRMRIECADVAAVEREALLTGVQIAEQHASRWEEIAGASEVRKALVAYTHQKSAAPPALCDELREHGLHDEKAGWTVDPAFLRWIREQKPERTAKGEAKGKKGSRRQASKERASALVFICHADQDAGWMNKLKTHLRPRTRPGDLAVWSRSDVDAGYDAQQETRRFIDEASVAVLLLSATFLATDSIASEELPRLQRAAEERGLALIPIVVSACDLEAVPSLARLRPVNPDQPLSALSESEGAAVLVEATKQILIMVGRR